jgi:uncharacterized protein
MAVEVQVAGLALDEKNKTPIVVLKDETGDKVLPIVIGVTEASAIAACLEGMDFPRPMTHDLLAATIRKLGAVLEKVEITDLINDTFYALLHVRRDDQVVTIDSRPSDSIALALRAEAKILVDEQVFEKSARQPLEGGTGSIPDDDNWKELLENLEDDDFGKYKV